MSLGPVRAASAATRWLSGGLVVSLSPRTSPNSPDESPARFVTSSSPLDCKRDLIIWANWRLSLLKLSLHAHQISSAPMAAIARPPIAGPINRLISPAAVAHWLVMLVSERQPMPTVRLSRCWRQYKQTVCAKHAIGRRQRETIDAIGGHANELHWMEWNAENTTKSSWSSCWLLLPRHCPVRHRRRRRPKWPPRD